MRLPERNTGLGLESEIVQLGHSYASKQSIHIDRSLMDGFWMLLPWTGEEVMRHASLGHIDIPHTSLVL